MYRIQTYNNIAIRGLDRFPRDRYEVASDINQPDALMLRSFNLHDVEIPDSVLAVGRAGSGVNNIPVAALSDRGVAVFNAPGANANAVKELVIAGLLLGARNLLPAAGYVQELDPSKDDFMAAVEHGKKRFTGFELPGRKLAVLGLGAIGVGVANAAKALGMEVVGFDPKVTVENAWRLDSDIERARSVEAALEGADAVTVHVPLTENTRHLVNAKGLEGMNPGAMVLNLAREGIVDDEAVREGLDAERLHAYITDFPVPNMLGHPRVITLPHLGASTTESEENCAVMIADQLRDYLENGNVVNSVNLPTLVLDRKGDTRIAVVNRNLPDRVARISHVLGESNLNILHLMNDSRGDLAYTLLDVDGKPDPSTLEALLQIDGVLRARVL
ncbi:MULTISPECIES: 3-phosphoglycerate dehydrogenase family protein [unclassified Thioalkalivibrio]|uniref:3-phosphoglycerate dehydrogenase family protein n=1 Tax=unclassified Thioalkalivibrio TaxID=2621013 RepID=UPI000369B376|nr:MULTISPECIES: 3-phosphoglycerate dehydrogenase family protein [unclassified Thioalkalivibrio]